jgi:hypothetical protein
MSEAEGDWYVEIAFLHPYDGVEIERRNGGLVVRIPFATEQSAHSAFDEMQSFVRPQYRVITGEILEGKQGG